MTYQTRKNADSSWVNLADDAWAYRNGIAEAMQVAGLRYSEIALHLKDLANGEVLTADNGRQFRVEPCTHSGGVEIQRAEADTNTRYGVFCADCGADVTKAACIKCEEPSEELDHNAMCPECVENARFDGGYRD